VPTVGDLLSDAADKLRAAGVQDSPALDARMLLAHVLHVDAARIPLMGEYPLSASTISDFWALIARRGTAEPIAYITGRKGFWEHDFQVRPGVLIPRPDTETLVQAVLDCVLADQPQHLLELGVGSGAVIASLLHERPLWQAVATDIDAIPIKVAGENARLANVSDRLSLYQGSWFAALADTDMRFDAILSNPPYITDDEMAELMPDVARHEPHLALHGGMDGLNAYREIIAQAPYFLKSDGVLAFEIGYDQGLSVSQIMGAAGCWQEPQILQDLGGRDRVVLTKLREM